MNKVCRRDPRQVLDLQERTQLSKVRRVTRMSSVFSSKFLRRSVETVLLQSWLSRRVQGNVVQWLHEIAAHLTCPTGLVAWQPSVRVIHLDRIAILESIHVHDDVETTVNRQAREQDAGMSCSQHHVRQDPCGRLDVHLEFQVSPVFAPVMPQLVP